MPPKQYQLSLRLRLSKQLLASTELKICEIAAQCGYPNVYYFSRAFSAANHMLPSEYRRRVSAT